MTDPRPEHRRDQDAGIDDDDLAPRTDAEADLLDGIEELLSPDPPRSPASDAEAPPPAL